MLDIYAIKTDGLQYYVGQCPDEDDTVEALLRLLSREQQHADTARFNIVRQGSPDKTPLCVSISPEDSLADTPIYLVTLLRRRTSPAVYVFTSQEKAREFADNFAKEHYGIEKHEDVARQTGYNCALALRKTYIR